MANHAVHWGQGLFLLPHHFQTAERSLREEIMLSENWYEGYAYGLHRIVIDEEALSNWQVILKTCHARCQDGSHIRYSESVDESSRLFADVPKDAFTRDEPAMVYLVFPKLQMGRKNSDPAGSGDSNSRYLVESQEIADENEEGNIQTLEIRLPNVKLVVGDEGLAGYEVLLPGSGKADSSKPEAQSREHQTGRFHFPQRESGSHLDSGAGGSSHSSGRDLVLLESRSRFRRLARCFRNTFDRNSYR
jgi:hypothetical protein